MWILKGLWTRSVCGKVTGANLKILKELEEPRGGRTLFAGPEESSRLNKTSITYWYRKSRITCKWFACCRIGGASGWIGAGEIQKMAAILLQRRWNHIGAQTACAQPTHRILGSGNRRFRKMNWKSHGKGRLTCLSIVTSEVTGEEVGRACWFGRGKTTARHTSRDFVAFLEAVLSLCPPRQQIHIILDNLSAHKTQAVRDFLQRHPRVQFHFTPTYSSWLNQVEIWFAKIEREVIARGIFTSVPDLARKLRRYINAYSSHARPIRWKYSDPTHRLRTNELTATRH